MSADLRLGRWQDALADVGEVDTVIVDAPYSARTHGGHDRGVERVNRGVRTGKFINASYGYEYERKAIGYDGWSPADVSAFVDAWSTRCRGWFVTITDHALAPVWESALENAGRYVFAPLPWVARGSRVRLAGDGPSTWTCWIVVARPRTGTDRTGRPYNKWGTLPGAYVVNQMHHARRENTVQGAKPLPLMRALVRDYTRPGDIVCDPCAGGATTLIAAHQEGRIGIGAEMDPETHALGLRRIERHTQQADLWTQLEQRKGEASQGALTLEAE